MNTYEMQTVNINWVEKIPVNWKFKRLKDTGTFKSGRDYKHLADGNIPLFGSSETPFAFVNEAICNKKAVAVGRKGTIDKPFITPNIFWAVDTCLYNTVSNKSWKLEYVYYWMKIIPFKYIGSQTAIPSLTQTQVNNVFIPQPSLKQQIVIANYLDFHTTKIDTEISLLKKKSILLDEYKNSLIFETVTKGLDKNAVMKDSGIDWIGEIPEHWKVDRLKNSVKYLKLTKAILDSRNYLEIGDIDVSTNQYDLETKDKLSVDTAKIAPKGTLVISTVRPNRKAITITNFEHPVSNAFCALKCNKYWFYLIKTDGFANELASLNRSSIYPTCKDIDILNQVVCIPSEPEQNNIYSFLDSETNKIENQIELINKKIELLKEYKQSLIYEAVTGQLEIE